MVEENILPLIPENLITVALNSLPPAATSPFEKMERVVVVPGLGSVVVKFRKMTHKGAKGTLAFWMAVKAMRRH